MMGYLIKLRDYMSLLALLDGGFAYLTERATKGSVVISTLKLLRYSLIRWSEKHNSFYHNERKNGLTDQRTK